MGVIFEESVYQFMLCLSVCIVLALWDFLKYFCFVAFLFTENASTSARECEYVPHFLHPSGY